MNKNMPLVLLLPEDVYAFCRRSAALVDMDVSRFVSVWLSRTIRELEERDGGVDRYGRARQR